VTVSVRRPLSSTWLWHMLFLFGWPTVIGLVRVATSLITHDVPGIRVSLSALAMCLVLIALAWAVARWAFVRGAPAGIVGGIALASVGHAFVLALALHYLVPDATALYAAILVVALMPPCAALLAARLDGGIRPRTSRRSLSGT
jgi:hypothetical protein